MATDQVGIKLLLEDSGALECHTKWLTAVRFSEIGSSEVILNAGCVAWCWESAGRGVEP